MGSNCYCYTVVSTAGSTAGPAFLQASNALMQNASRVSFLPWERGLEGGLGRDPAFTNVNSEILIGMCERPGSLISLLLTAFAGIYCAGISTDFFSQLVL